MPIQPRPNHAHEVTKYAFRHLSHICVKEQPPCHPRQSHCCAPWPSSPSFLCSRPATITRRRRPPSLSARCRSARRLRKRECDARIRGRGARPLRDRSRLQGRRQDRQPRRQCRRSRTSRRRGGAARSAGPEVAGRERRGRVRRGDLKSSPGRVRPRTLYHAEDARLGLDRRLRSQEGGEG